MVSAEQKISSLAGALQMVWIPSLCAPSSLLGRVGRFGQHSIDFDQYPTDQSDQAGKQDEHPAKGHEV
jgi:hypothetical protein